MFFEHLLRAMRPVAPGSAICKDASALILDEATSALDTRSGHADRVIAREHGRIAEQGPHAQLLASGGLCARLHAMQFRG